MKAIKKEKRSFVQWFIAIVVTLLLGTIATINTIRLAYADDVSGLSDATIGVSYDSGTGKSVSATGTTLTITSTGSKDSCDNGQATTTTVTIKNLKSSLATLSFDYALTLNEGSVTIDGGNKTANGSFSKDLNPNGTITVVVKSKAENGAKTTAKLTNLSLLSKVYATTTFNPDESNGIKGYYTVASTDPSFSPSTQTVTDTGITHYQQAIYKYTITATANAGYDFDCWHIGSSINDSQTITNFDVTENTTIFPVFKPAGNATYIVTKKGTNTTTVTTRYYDLNTAIEHTNSTYPVVSVVGDGILPAETYYIPSGVTLLIPSDITNTIFTNEPQVVYGSHATPTAYKTLTMSSGSSIVIQSGGSICCNSKLCSSGQMGGWNGTPTGPDGRINMQSNSTITVQSGGNLYVWGYIYGSGSITAQSGSNVYEAFQIKDWRGGTATSSVYDYAFIFNQYYVQNIEVPLTINSGATEKLYSSVNASSSAHPIGTTFIGSGGLFSISTGYIVKDYDESTDRLHVSVYGDVSLSALTISGVPMIGSVSTAAFTMPITSNITIDIKSGTTSINQDIELLPGVEINADSGSNLNILSEKKVYVYDSSDWGNFSGTQKMYVIGYSVANGEAAIRTAADLKDAKININGTMNIAGNLFTSNGGANIFSSEASGKIVFATAPTSSSVTLYECANNSTKTAVTFTSAKLRNGSFFKQGSTKTYEVTEYDDEGNNPSSHPDITVASDYSDDHVSFSNTTNESFILTAGASSGTTFYFNYTDTDNVESTANIAIYGYWWTKNFSPNENATTKAKFKFYYGSGANDFEEAEYNTTSNSYTFPTTVHGVSPFRWITSDENYLFRRGHVAHKTDEDNFLNNIFPNSTTVFYPFNGGWVERSATYYSHVDGEPVTEGLHRVEDPALINQNINILENDYCLFDSNGRLRYEVNGFEVADNKELFFSYGVVQEGLGLVSHLVDETMYLFYIKEDGTAVKGCTFYVTKVNDYYVNSVKVEPGLYYFDGNGHMYYGNDLIDDDHPFEEINSGITQQGGN